MSLRTLTDTVSELESAAKCCNCAATCCKHGYFRTSQVRCLGLLYCSRIVPVLSLYRCQIMSLPVLSVLTDTASGLGSAAIPRPRIGHDMQYSCSQHFAAPSQHGCSTRIARQSDGDQKNSIFMSNISKDLNHCKF